MLFSFQPISIADLVGRVRCTYGAWPMNVAKLHNEHDCPLSEYELLPSYWLDQLAAISTVENVTTCLSLRYDHRDRTTNTRSDNHNKMAMERWQRAIYTYNIGNIGIPNEKACVGHSDRELPQTQTAKNSI